MKRKRSSRPLSAAYLLPQHSHPNLVNVGAGSGKEIAYAIRVRASHVAFYILGRSFGIQSRRSSCGRGDHRRGHLDEPSVATARASAAPGSYKIAALVEMNADA